MKFSMQFGCEMWAGTTGDPARGPYFMTAKRGRSASSAAIGTVSFFDMAQAMTGMMTARHP